MYSVQTERKGPLPDHGIQRQSSIKMREKVASTRRLVFQRLGQLVPVNRNKEQVALLNEVTRRRFPDLGCGGKMNETIRQINWRTFELARQLGFLPEFFGNDLIDDMTHCDDPAAT